MIFVWCDVKRPVRVGCTCRAGRLLLFRSYSCTYAAFRGERGRHGVTDARLRACSGRHPGPVRSDGARVYLGDSIAASEQRISVDSPPPPGARRSNDLLFKQLAFVLREIQVLERVCNLGGINFDFKLNSGRFTGHVLVILKFLHLSRASLSVSRPKKPSASISPMKVALGVRPETPHQSATVMPRVKRPSVSISTLTWRPRNRPGRIK